MAAMLKPLKERLTADPAATLSLVRRLREALGASVEYDLRRAVDGADAVVMDIALLLALECRLDKEPLHLWRNLVWIVIIRHAAEDRNAGAADRLRRKGGCTRHAGDHARIGLRDRPVALGIQPRLFLLDRDQRLREPRTLTAFVGAFNSHRVQIFGFFEPGCASGTGLFGPFDGRNEHDPGAAFLGHAPRARRLGHRGAPAVLGFRVRGWARVPLRVGHR